MGHLNTVAAALRRVFQRGRPLPLRESRPDLQAWSKSACGREILQEQKAQMDDLLKDLFGYHLLELSSLSNTSMASECPINHHFRLFPEVGNGVGALADPEQLPLADESLDLVILHHMLEYSSNPHQLLREANRVLIPRGHLLIVGFNPFSLQGVVKFFAQYFSSNRCWRRHSLNRARLVDWLNLLDCEPVEVQRGFYRPPINQQKVLSLLEFWERTCRFLNLPFGGYYVLLACKQRLSVTPIKPAWGRFNPMPGLVLGDSAHSARQSSEASKCHPRASCRKSKH